MSDMTKYHQARRELDALTNEQLGSLFREYLGEADHNGWDGWADKFPTNKEGDLEVHEVIVDLMVDMALYQAHRN
jgi:hypothetical protein